MQVHGNELVINVDPRAKFGQLRRLAQNLIDLAWFKVSSLQRFQALRSEALSSIRRHRFRFS